jgi:hypothetical protein
MPLKRALVHYLRSQLESRMAGGDGGGGSGGHGGSGVPFLSPDGFKDVARRIKAGLVEAATAWEAGTSAAEGRPRERHALLLEEAAAAPPASGRSGGGGGVAAGKVVLTAAARQWVHAAMQAELALAGLQPV